MSVAQHKLVGARIPAVRLGELVDGQVRAVRANEAFGSGPAVIVGMPGAFTPVCTQRHLPSLLQNAARLRQSGFAHVVCVVASDPFATDAWRQAMDPAGRVRFLSDGNLSMARALGLLTHAPRLFLGECSERYMLTTRDGVIDSARVEDDLLDLSCTDPDELVLDAV